MMTGADGELAGRSARGLADLVRTRQTSAREVVEAHLRRIEERNSSLTALVTVRADEALADADEVDRRVARDEDLPFAGVPFTVKDIIAAAGVRMTAGSNAMPPFVPRLDATAVGRMRGAGAILLGKTNCPEFGMFGYTRNARFGETRNPLRAVTVGGSSGGEAAAVASGCSALGIGTDFGGSVRWPAHCTGLVGLRATAGRVPGTGQLPAPSLVEPLSVNETTLQGRMQIIGPLARDAADAEAALHVIAGPDGLDPFAVPAPLGWSTRPPAAVALWEGPSAPTVREDVRAVVAEAAAALAARGTRVVEDRPAMLERAVTLYSELRETDRLQDVRRLLAGHEEEAGEDVRAAIAAVLGRERDLARVDVARLWEERDRVRAALLTFLERAPILLMPVATVPPFDESEPLTVDGRDQAMWDVLAPCRLISLLGVPAASVPFGRSADGLPIGVQVVGRPFREDEVLAVAGMLMEARSPGEAPRAEVAG